MNKQTQEALNMAGYDLDGVIADVEKFDGFDNVCLETIKRVRNVIAEALEQPNACQDTDIALYTNPHQWQGLTDDEALKAYSNAVSKVIEAGAPYTDKTVALATARAIEQELRSKNHG